MKNKSRAVTTLYTTLILVLLLLVHHQTVVELRQLNEQNYKNDLEIRQLEDNVIALKRRIGELRCE